MCPVGTITGPRGQQGDTLVTKLVPETITEVDPGPNHTLGPTFNDAEILPWVIEEHVTCWYHHWTLGGSRGTHWLRKLVPQTITEVDPGPNHTLGPTFNDAEILPWALKVGPNVWFGPGSTSVMVSGTKFRNQCVPLLPPRVQ